ncbi:glycosyltransferase family 2 protein [Tellurirhabdus bombi]|uniref:glycosyltransferase family 2 protein n=1 Tax=Tellurirhabdus bombi TaxID=2907205 RepID=UPI001F195052|nr:glycosyltransferase family 2 protein [Tellurirhabdus bombi]
MQTPYSIAVIIPTFNRKRLLQTLLDQLLQQQAGAFLLEIIVVVDGSTDGTTDLLQQQFPTVHTIQGSGNWWFTRCVNEGIRFAQARLKSSFVLILNDDSEIAPDYLLKLTQAHAQVAPDAIMGSLSVSLEQPHRITFSGTKKTVRWLMKTIPYTPPFEAYEAALFSGHYPTESLNGRGTLVPMSVFDRIGLLDERRFPQYGSDDDLALTATKAGIPVYISWDAVVFDPVSLTAAGTVYLKPSLSVFLNSFFSLYSVNSLRKTVYFYQKHGLPVVWPFGVLLSIVATWRAYLWKYRRLKMT